MQKEKVERRRDYLEYAEGQFAILNRVSWRM